MNLIPDVIHNIDEYLSLKERLYWSSVNKEYFRLINRKNILSRISATLLTRYIVWNFPFYDKKYLREDIKWFMKPKNDFRTLTLFGNDILNQYNIHIYSEWFTSVKCYKVNKIIESKDIWDHNPRIIKNQMVCAVYRFRKLGITKKKKNTSLTVKALIY